MTELELNARRIACEHAAYTAKAAYGATYAAYASLGVATDDTDDAYTDAKVAYETAYKDADDIYKAAYKTALANL